MREKLIRELFALERDFHYWEFRQRHWNHAEVVATCPDLDQRDTMLRGFWSQDAEKRYPEYLVAADGLSMEQLESEREHWLDRLSLLSPKQYQDILDEAVVRMPANDNERGMER